jgi:hypothetical protein
MAAARKDRDLAAEIAFLTRALKAPTPREFVGRLAERADRDRVGDRLGHQPLPQVPLARPAVQRRDLTGQRQRELVGQRASGRRLPCDRRRGALPTRVRSVARVITAHPARAEAGR